jgi:molybdate transport system substrate-binding protein
MKRFFWWLSGVVAVFGGCGAGSAVVCAADLQSLTVSAASSLSDVLGEIKAAYAKTEAGAGVTLIFNFGGSGLLQQQIAHGAPVDVFIAAAPGHIEALGGRGLLLPGSRRDLLSNRLVLIVPGDARKSIERSEDLRADAVRRIMIGDPRSVPAGAYAEEALAALHLTDAIRPKLVRALNVRQVLTAVETRNVDAGFVYATDAQRSDKVRVAVRVPPELHAAIIYPVAIVANSRNRSRAARFVAFLADDPVARKLFLKWGFLMKE